MSSYRFFQGIRGEWVWYHLTDTGVVLAKGDGSFATLEDCMANAQRFGFDGHTFTVDVQRDHADLVSARDDDSFHEFAAPPAQTGGSERESAEG